MSRSVPEIHSHVAGILSNQQTNISVVPVICCSGILVPGGFGLRGIEGKILAAQWARCRNIPYLGKLCFIVFKQTAIVMRNV